MTTDVAEPQATEPVAQTPESNDELNEAREFIATLDTPSQAPEETAAATPDGTGDETPEPPQDEDELAAINAAAERIAAEKLEQERAQLDQERTKQREEEAENQRKSERKKVFDNAAPQVRSWLSQKGLEGEDVDYFLNWFTGYNGQIDAVSADRMSEAFRYHFSQALPEGERSDFQAKEFDSSKALAEDFAKRIREDARKGYVPEKSEAEQQALAVVKLKKRFRDNPQALQTFLNSLNAPNNHSPTSGGGKHYGSEDELHTAFTNGEVSRKDYADEYKRLTGKDL